MINTEHLTILTGKLSKLLHIEETALSSRIFDDSNRLHRLREGSDILLSSYTRAIAWMRVHWPEDDKSPEFQLLQDISGSPHYQG
jgi:hypothetical protein